MTSEAPDEAPVLLVLPGAGYTVLGPLLCWPVAAMKDAGWDVWSVDWHTEARGLAPDDFRSFVDRHVSRAVDELPRPPAAVLGKSLGSYALPRLVSSEIRGVWLTPILTDEDVASAARLADARHLLIGGTSDRSWRPDVLDAGTSARTITMPSGDHSLVRSDSTWSHSVLDQIAIIRDVVDHLIAAEPR